MKLKERYSALLQERRGAHRLAAERLSDVESSETYRQENLGESSRRGFLAAADHQVDVSTLSAEEVTSRVQALFQAAEVVFATKRTALVRVGALICHCNRFGVGQYVLPWDDFGDKWGSVHFVPNFGCSLLDAIGAVGDGFDRRDQLYNYSACRQ